jgi:oligoribonuclease NrnB/cAMP/cGMP phosphodiesterase (DHH superfamily)
VFTRETILKTKNVFYHSGCPDGIAAREIFKKIEANFSHKLNFIPYYFEQPILGTEREELIQDSLFIDVHPPKDEWKELESKYDFLVADHHATSAPFMLDVEKHLRGDNALAESGAMLAAQISEVVCKARFKDIWDFASIIAISDTWKKEDPRFTDARKLANYILFFGNDWSGFMLPDHPQVQTYSKIRKAQIEAIADHALLRDCCGYKLAFVNTGDTSDAAELLRARGINVVVGFKVLCIDGEERINYSLRSDDKFSVRAVAERFGGGGHEQAAGCSTKYMDRNPIEYFLAEFTAHVTNSNLSSDCESGRDVK